jgi:endonuclease/exonuclease/phosphatase family metal-dependent hydrolase
VAATNRAITVAPGSVCHHAGVRVVSWNVWWRFGPWEQRQEPIASVLRLLDADVICLQEVFADADSGRDQAEELASALGMKVARARRPDGRPVGFGNAVLSRWSLSDEATVVLPTADGSKRAAVVARVDGPGGAFTATSLHLSWQYDATAERQRQLDVVVAEIGRRQQDLDRPAVLAGDLNAVPESDEVRRLTGLARPYVEGLVFTDSWAVAGDGPGHTWTRDNPHTADAQFPRRRVDHVMVSWPRPKPLGNPLRAVLAGTEPIAGVMASDHYAVVVDLDDRRESS